MQSKNIILKLITRFAPSFENENNVNETITLLKKWSRAKGFDAIISFPLSVYFLHLLNKNVIRPKMLPIIMFRKTLLEFSETNWDSEPFWISDNEPENLNKLKKQHEVLFLDNTGSVNLCDRLPKDIYYGAKNEAKLALDIIDTDDESTLEKALVEVEFLDKFDVIIMIDSNCIQDVPIKRKKKARYSGQETTFAIRHIINVLYKGLGRRVKLIQHEPFLSTSTSKQEAEEEKIKCIRIGLILNPDEMLNNIERGPSADLEEAKEFREFWGKKSELRKFHDGSICEAVFWDAKNMEAKRAIIGRVVKHLLFQHANIHKKYVKITGQQLDFVLHIHKNDALYGTGEEAFLGIVSTFDELTKKFQSLKDLPLMFTSIQGVSAVFRGTEVFPPLKITSYPTDLETINNCFIFCNKKHYIRCKPIKVVVNLEITGKWPRDLEPLRKVKALYYIELKEVLFEQFHIYSKPSFDYLDVFYDGYIWRFTIATNQEIKILRRNPISENNDLDTIELFTNLLPTISSALSGVNRSFTAYGTTTRYVKRWLSCHLLYDYFTDEIIDLMVASLFLDPYPYSPPQTPLVGFTRFLDLLSSFDFQKKPIIVNFNNSLTHDDIKEIENNFISKRSTFGLIGIFTSFSKDKSPWTSEKPVLPILKRTSNLAKISYEVIHQVIKEIFKSNFKLLFTPQLNVFHICINLKREYCNLMLNLNFTENYCSQKKFESKSPSVDALPIVDYDPMRCYVESLRTHFGKIANFFFDSFGGYRIFVLWKPGVFNSKPLTTGSDLINYKMAGTVVTEDGTPNVKIDVESILEDIEILGNGIVDYIETNTDKWN